MIEEPKRIRCGTCPHYLAPGGRVTERPELAELFDSHTEAGRTARAAGWQVQSESVGGDRCPVCLGGEVEEYTTSDFSPSILTIPDYATRVGVVIPSALLGVDRESQVTAWLFSFLLAGPLLQADDVVGPIGSGSSRRSTRQ